MSVIAGILTAAAAQATDLMSRWSMDGSLTSRWNKPRTNHLWLLAAFSLFLIIDRTSVYTTQQQPQQAPRSSLTNMIIGTADVSTLRLNGTLRGCIPTVALFC